MKYMLIKRYFMYPMMPMFTEYNCFLYILLRLLKKTLITPSQFFLLEQAS
ncbi:hypothetical protein IIM_04443 [Bacillus cereus VD107]|nr:hypothetical protein IIM_04443 [Bacillus cereus VD107]